MFKLAASGAIIALFAPKKAECWIYRDDIGAWWGIKGYEE